MKFMLLAFLLLAGGEQERGLSLYAAGDYAGAAQAFRAAMREDPDNAEIAYDLSLALWSAGDAEGAEVAAEQAATLSNGALDHLRDGLLGNLRYAAAQAKQKEDLQGALDLAERARSNFLRGALAAGSGQELRRNLERSNLLIDELKKKIEEQKKKDKKDQKDQKDQKEKKGDKGDEGKKGDKNGDQSEGPDQEPQPKPEPKPEPKQSQASDAKPEPEKKELSPEQARRLLQALDQLEKQKLKLRASRRAQRPKVKKDW